MLARHQMKVPIYMRDKAATEIANQFGITERLVQQRLAIANLIGPILTLYRNGDIHGETVRTLTMATKRQQKSWLFLHKSEDEYAPTGRALKEWLFGGANIPVQNALFDLADYKGSIISDLFGDERYFADSEKFWPLQNTAIAEAKERYIAKGWNDVVLLEVGAYWSSWEYSEVSKKKGGKIYVDISNDGEVTFHEGFLTSKEVKQREKASNGEDAEKPIERPELTKVMQNYLDLHRHAAVRAELLNHAGIALRLAVAQIIAGSDLWRVQAEPQKANSEAIAESLAANKAEDWLAVERQAIQKLLGNTDKAHDTVVPLATDYGRSNDIAVIFAKLIALDDQSVNRILTFIVAEALPVGNGIVEALGSILNVDMSEVWQVDEAFFALLRDKEAISAMLKQVGSKQVADAHITSTAKMQKKMIADYLDGTRKPHKKDWQPRYMDFPMRSYTKRSSLDAIDNWKAVKKHFA